MTDHSLTSTDLARASQLAQLFDDEDTRRLELLGYLLAIGESELADAINEYRDRDAFANRTEAEELLLGVACDAWRILTHGRRPTPIDSEVPPQFPYWDVDLPGSISQANAWFGD